MKRFNHLFAPEIDEMPELSKDIFFEKIRAIRATGKPETSYDDEEFFLLLVAGALVVGRTFAGAKNNAIFRMKNPEEARALHFGKSTVDADVVFGETFRKELQQRWE